MTKKKCQYREGVVVVRFSKDTTKKQAEVLIETHCMTIEKWYEKTNTAVVAVPKGKERSRLKYLERLSYTSILSVCLDLCL